MAETTVQSQVDERPTRPIPPRRPKRSFPQRVGYVIRARVKHSLSRDSLIAGLKSLAWVAPMTVLIWIYAEREQITKQPVEFHLTVNAGPDRIVELRVPGPDGRSSGNLLVHADLAGPQGAFQRLRDEMDRRAGVVEVFRTLEQGVHKINTSELLDKNDRTHLFDTYGQTISNLTPKEIDVFVDLIVHREVKVEIQPGIPYLERPPIFIPATVDVTGPMSVLKAAFDEKRLVAYAELPKSSPPPGEQTIANVPISVQINNPNVKLSRPSVTAEVIVKNSEKVGIIRSLPVYVLTTIDPVWDTFKPDIDKNLLVEIVGPADVVDKMTDVTSQITPAPHATLDLGNVKPEISNPPRENVQYEAPLIYDFGETGVKLNPNATTNKHSLTFKIVRRNPL